MSTATRRRLLEVEDAANNVCVVTFVDTKILDETNIKIIGEDWFYLVDELGRRKVILDFRDVVFYSAAALGILIALHRKLMAYRGQLILCNIRKEIRDVFEMTKLDLMFTIVPTKKEALQALS